MATDIKISQMPSATSLEGTELIPIVQGGTNRTTTPNKLKEGLATVAQLGNKVDKDGNKVLSEENFTTELKNKLDGIEAEANKYEHPTNHPASMITEDATHKFVTDTEKATWNGKANAEDIPDVSGFATTAQLNNKLDTSTYNSDKATFATKSELGAKLDSSTYNSEKANFASKVSTEDVTENTKELQPNKYYIFGEVETLTLTLAAGEEGKLAEYMFEFTSGTTPTTITDIEGVEWKGDTIEADKVYQASISRGIGILIGRAKA